MQTKIYAKLISLIQSLSGVVFASIELGRIKALKMREVKSVVGKPVGSIPQREYLLLANKYGSECWDDREFVRDFFKSQGHLKAGNI